MKKRKLTKAFLTMALTACTLLSSMQPAYAHPNTNNPNYFVYYESYTYHPHPCFTTNANFDKTAPMGLAYDGIGGFIAAPVYHAKLLEDSIGYYVKRNGKWVSTQFLKKGKKKIRVMPMSYWDKVYIQLEPYPGCNKKDSETWYLVDEGADAGVSSTSLDPSIIKKFKPGQIWKIKLVSYVNCGISNKTGELLETRYAYKSQISKGVFAFRGPGDDETLLRKNYNIPDKKNTSTATAVKEKMIPYLCSVEKGTIPHPIYYRSKENFMNWGPTDRFKDRCAALDKMCETKVSAKYRKHPEKLFKGRWWEKFYKK